MKSIVRAVAVLAPILMASSGQAQPVPVNPPVAQSLGLVVSDVVIRVDPPEARVGQRFRVWFRDVPPGGMSDELVVVEAGAPDDGSAQVLARGYTENELYREAGFEIGPFAPGTYEVRWMTTLYNNDGRLEVGARARFTVVR